MLLPAGQRVGGDAGVAGQGGDGGVPGVGEQGGGVGAVFGGVGQGAVAELVEGGAAGGGGEQFGGAAVGQAGAVGSVVPRTATRPVGPVGKLDACSRTDHARRGE